MRRLLLNFRIGSVSRCRTAGGIVAISLFVLSIFSPGCGPDARPAFDGESAFVFLEEQCDIGFRYPGTAEHRKLQRYLVDKLKSFDANVSLQPFDGFLSTGDTLHLINIIANYNMGSDKRILLGAHYDTRPVADMDPDPANRSKPILGANDGASGIAVLLEIARLLQSAKPPVGVDIVLFDGEDYGDAGKPFDFCLGSTHFARNLKGYKPLSAIIIDMIGKKGLQIRREAFSDRMSPQLLDEIFSIAAEIGAEEFVSEGGDTIIDDHLPFIRAGIQAVDLIDFDYPSWHTLEDTPDKCSPASLEAVGSVLVEYIWRQKD